MENNKYYSQVVPGNLTSIRFIKIEQGGGRMCYEVSTVDS